MHMPFLFLPKSNINVIFVFRQFYIFIYFLKFLLDAGISNICFPCSSVPSISSYLFERILVPTAYLVFISFKCFSKVLISISSKSVAFLEIISLSNGSYESNLLPLLKWTSLFGYHLFFLQFY